MEEGVVVRAPRDRFGTVMTERVQHNGVVGLTRECESASHRGDPERGSVETFRYIFVFIFRGIANNIHGWKMILYTPTLTDGDHRLRWTHR